MSTPGPNTRSRKRQRSNGLGGSEVAPDEKGFKHHDSLWFEDGNIVLLADNVAFKVHRGILVRHSDVFCDMFAIPQPPSAEQETFEGTARVTMQDDAERLADFLLILYDGGKKYVQST